MINLIYDENLLKKRYPIYGSILFTNAHPNVIKCLRDNDYWNALNEISGDNLPIFANRLFEGKSEFPVFPPNVMGMMIPIWKEPNQNKEILQWFCLENSRNPLLVLFGFGTDKIYQSVYELNNESPQKTYESLSKPIEKINNVLTKMSHIDKPENLFRAVDFEIKKVKSKDFAKKTFSILSTFRGAAGI